MDAQAILEEVTATLVARFRPRRIVLFGSHARGEADEESDLDLFVELDTDLGRRPLERAVAVREVFGLHRWPMDLLVYTSDEVARMREERASLLDLLENEGKVLYEQS